MRMPSVAVVGGSLGGLTAPHEPNLLDIQAKYADVVSLQETLDYLRVAEPGLRTAS